MYCSACNLQYSDPLKYCRQCGRQLVQQVEERAASNRCCTRCGARAIASENFCQQCGARLKVRSEDTTIGTCASCGTPWRSAWLYCRSCGTDRDHALQFKSAPAPPEQAVPTLTNMEAVSPDSVETPETNPSLDAREIARELIGKDAHCSRCGAEALPYAQFCEICGGSLTVTAVSDKQGETPRKIETFRPAVSQGEEIVPRRQTDRINSSPADLYLNDFEPEMKVQERGVTTRPPARTSLIDDARSTSNIKRKIITPDEAAPEDIGDVDVSWSARSKRAAQSAGLNLSATRGRRAAWQRASIATCLAVLGALLVLIIWQRQRSTTVAEVTPSPENKAAPSPNPSPNTNSSVAPEGMIYIAGGTFRLGRDDGDEYERPAREVKVEAFYMDRTEVTNEQYLRFIGETKRAQPSHWGGSQYPSGQANFPVVNVSWEDANAYARWAGKRLPTEEEWEYAARGGEGRLYPWGNDWSDSLANTREGERGRIVAVGSFPAGASPLGLLDLVGNVWEWTSSDLSSYAGNGQILAPGKVIRGGAYDVARERANATYRGVVQPERTYEKTGFRCVKPAQ